MGLHQKCFLLTAFPEVEAPKYDLSPLKKRKKKNKCYGTRFSNQEECIVYLLSYRCLEFTDVLAHTVRFVNIKYFSTYSKIF